MRAFRGLAKNTGESNGKDMNNEMHSQLPGFGI